MIVRKVNVVGPMRCEYYHWPSLLDLLKEGAWDIVDSILEAEVAILDDVGSGHDPSKFGVDKLCQILSRREKRWTLITTNCGPTQWAEAFDRRIASRFLRYSTVVDLSSVPDFTTP